MSKAAPRQPFAPSPNIDNPPTQRDPTVGESQFESWASVAQDLWGTRSFAVGQASAVARAANAITIKRQHLVGAIGGVLGGFEEIAAERDATIEIFECNLDIIKHRHHSDRIGRGRLVFHTWDPEHPNLEAGHFDSLVAFRAFEHVSTPESLASTLANAVKPGGLLFVEEIYAADVLVAPLLASTIAPHNDKLFLRGYDVVMHCLEWSGLALRSTTTVTSRLVTAIKSGFARAERIAESLTALPEPFRMQRLTALRDEMQRAAALAQALDRGLATAIRTLHRKRSSD